MTISRIRRLRDDERGMTLIFVGLSFMGLLAATTLAIDVGMFMSARNQAQNSADAAAMAGAIALAFDDYDDRSWGGPAVQNAVTAGTRNAVMGDGVSIDPDDVTFPAGPNGEDNRIRVFVHRTAERGNPISTLMGRVFGVDTVNMMAVATAEAAPADAMTCVKPFILPDRWIENTDPPWDPDTSTFEAFDNKGNPLPNADVYVPATPTDPGSGYNAQRDKGTRLMIRAGTGNNIQPTFYFSLVITGDMGGNDYRWNIANCNTTLMRVGHLPQQEPGNMVGPTMDGVQQLFDKDPTAYWDDLNQRVVSDMHPSPRVAVIPLYDPLYYAEGKKQGRNADLKVANFLGFFIESIQGNTVYGRITPVAGVLTGNNAGPVGAFPKAIRLVE